MSSLGEFSEGFMVACCMATFGFPIVLYMMYILLIPFGGIAIWGNGWGELEKVMNFSRWLTYGVGLLMLTGATDDGDIVTPAYAYGYVAACPLIQLVWVRYAWRWLD